MVAKWGMKRYPLKISGEENQLIKTTNGNVTLCKKAFHYVDKTKPLGIMISDKLSWSCQVEYVTGKANRVIG